MKNRLNSECFVEPLMNVDKESTFGVVFNRSSVFMCKRRDETGTGVGVKPVRLE